MRKKQNLRKFTYLLLTLFLLVITIISGQVSLSAFAETVEYSGVLTDLFKDSSFNINDYPSNPTDYSIQVIQIAESTDGELFIYTYQPCQATLPLVATEINMSLSESVDGTLPYKLTQVSVGGVFAKYKVIDFTVSKDKIRYYNITSIYRNYDEKIDTGSTSESILEERAFPVGKCYVAITVNGTVEYECKEVETIDIIAPWYGSFRYREGTSLFTRDYIDSHFVAFSTDKDIDRLIEADVTYVTRSCVETINKGPFGDKYKVEYGDPQPPVVMTISDTMTGHSEYHNFWFADKKDGTTWKRIQSVDEFINSEELTDEAKNNLKSRQWVLRFVETEYSEDWQAVQRIYSTNVLSVSILRLKFETDGKVYNLGAVSDMGHSDGVPDNPQEPEFNFFKYVWNCIVKLFKGDADFIETLVAIVAMLVVLVLLPLVFVILSVIFPVFGEVLKTIFKGLWTAILWLLKGLWWLICLPFKGIKALVNKIRGE